MINCINIYEGGDNFSVIRNPVNYIDYPKKCSIVIYKLFII